MPTALGRLRDDLDFLPSPMSDRPGLLVRDPFRYSEVAIILPPPLIQCLTCFDGAHTDEDLVEMIRAATGRPDAGEAAGGLVRGLSDSGFLHDEVFFQLRARQHDSFVQSPIRKAAFAGDGYPRDPGKLTRLLEGWITGAPGDAAVGDPGAGAKPTPSQAPQAPFAIAAPHVSPSGGSSSYGAAYRALGPELADRTFVILATSHYGRPNRIGLTRKSFQTPLGETTTDNTLVDQLEVGAPDAVDIEDYCHAVEHSIEFQVLFLQSRFGAAVRILPVLCGPFLDGAPGTGRRPENDDGVARALEALGQLRPQKGSGLFWVLGVDMAHMGRRYGDPWGARAFEGEMNDVAARDRDRLGRVIHGDADGFWDLVHERGHDDLKWCGSAPLYAFLRVHPGARGQVLEYDQWNIDDQSVVSFAALAFNH